MERDDIEYLLRVLSNMDGAEEIKVGPTVWTATDLFDVVEDALRWQALREQAARPAPGFES